MMIFYLISYILGLGSCVYGLCKLLALSYSLNLTQSDLWFYPIIAICGLIVAIFVRHLL